MDLNEICTQVILKDMSLKASNDPDLILQWLELNDRHIWLDEEIEWDTCAFIIRFIQYLNRAEAGKEVKEPIHLHIFSYGGELPVMFTLYDTIKNSEIPVYTYNEGAAHSAAFIVFLAGDKRFATKHSTFIAHEGSSAMQGSYRESKAAMAAYEQDVDTMKEIISLETDLTSEEIEGRFETSQDWYIRYSDMVAHGIIKE